MIPILARGLTRLTIDRRPNPSGNQIKAALASDSRYAEMASYLSSNHYSLFAKDYLGLRERVEIVQLMKRNGEDLTDFKCYSDYMYRITPKDARHNRVVFITG